MRQALRPLLALLLIGTFGFRVAAAGTLPQCVAGMEYSQHASHGHDTGQHHHGQAPNLPACECVGHSCSSSTAALTPTLSLAAPQFTATAALIAEAARLPGSDSDHLLPFAHGPPPLFG
jgi:hypothetical protein